MRVVIDPSSLFFSRSLPEAALRSRFDLLTYLLFIKRCCHELAFVTSTETVLILSTVGAYPYRQDFLGLQRQLDPDGVSSGNDLARLILELLQNASFEEYLLAKTAVWNAFQTLPNEEILTELPIEVVQLREVVFGLTAIHNSLVEHPLKIALATCTPDHIGVTLVCELTEPDLPSPLAPNLLPATVANTIFNINYDNNLSNAFDALAVWNNATSLSDFSLSIKIKCMQISGGKVPEFSLGNSFVESLSQWKGGAGGNYASVVLEKCARVLVEPHTQSIKPFTDTDGIQRIRSMDGAEAWRAHITKEGVALRLLYWRLSDGSYELANIGSKQELWIAF